ncbi:helix-turn-helix domain-containing protein [Bosea sp. RAF48]|uniref:helix-turn-helix domain-containing protein n=1 Tax=Bosea sp. RAF48 TaxID=3237480 RepID=UPI003F920BA3
MGTIVWRTEGLEPDSGFDYWRETVCRAVLGVSTEAPDPQEAFHGSLVGRSFGDVRIASFRSSRHDVVRTPRHVAQGDDSVLVSLQECGECRLSQGDERLLLQPGEIGLVDGARPFRLSFSEEVRRVVAVLPRRTLLLKAPWLVRGRPHRIPLASRFISLARQHILELARHGEVLDDMSASLLTDNLCNLIGLSSDAAGHSRDNLHEAILAFCRGRLGDETLSPGTVAAHFNISLRTLHARFAATGQSFGRWLLATRLEESRRALLDPRRTGESIASIAYSVGFGDLSVFNRAFRNRFGAAPRQHRGRCDT